MAWKTKLGILSPSEKAFTFEKSVQPKARTVPSLNVYCMDDELSHFTPNNTALLGHFRGEEVETDTEPSLQLHFAPL